MSVPKNVADKTALAKILSTMRLTINLLKAGEGEAALRQLAAADKLLQKELAK